MSGDRLTAAMQLPQMVQTDGLMKPRSFNVFSSGAGSWLVGEDDVELKLPDSDGSLSAPPAAATKLTNFLFSPRTFLGGVWKDLNNVSTLSKYLLTCAIQYNELGKDTF